MLKTISTGLRVVAAFLAAPPGLPVHDQAAGLSGIHKIKHVVIIMQENRSFDSYFGTFPGADGFPMKSGVPAVCAPDPVTHACVEPFHDPEDINFGGPHNQVDAVGDVDGGKMDGFIRRKEQGPSSEHSCRAQFHLLCGTYTISDDPPDVMGYHDARDPQLLELREELRAPGPYVLADRLLEPARAPVDGVRMVGGLQQARRPAQLHERRRHSTGRPDLAVAHPESAGDLSLDRSHLPAVQGPRELALLRGHGLAARLRGRSDALRATTAGRPDSRDLEPASALHHRTAGWPDPERAGSRSLLHGGQSREPAGGLLDRPDQ